MKFGSKDNAGWKGARILRAPGYEQVDEQWFRPEMWGDQAHSVAAGGRGSAWFIQSESGALVLRHYRRGGLAARVSDRRYLFTGFDKTRSFSEFRLLQSLHERGLPVPKPVAAIARRHGLSYEAAILIERIEGAQPLPEHPDVRDEWLWHRVGQTISWFHREGLDHVDLNCDNILVAGDDVFLIDFDRCILHKKTEGSVHWKGRNLKRLRRSVEKRCDAMTDCSRETLWRVLLDAYYEGAVGNYSL
ncbi:MAG: 3-deoxy-D-manno-octulosonic acid kinase [Marinobacter sp.]|nr:3-deoxy-D-manno-octulosonic acid kinase [Marinobacter sp.]